MTPMFFGRSESPLYGVYHPPPSRDRNQAVLLCYPFGQEYMRAHRAYRQLASQLTAIGFHVLRFDYRGTGDSSGDMETIDAANWLEDIADATQELRDVSGVNSVSVLGLRLGALFASSFCSQRRDIARLILFDPVTSGEEYEKQVFAEIAASDSVEYEVVATKALTERGQLYYNGFSMPARFRESLRELDLFRTIPKNVPKIFHVVSHESKEFLRMRDAWQAHPGYRYQCTDAPYRWNYIDEAGGILLPRPVITAIVGWMDAGDGA